MMKQITLLFALLLVNLHVAQADTLYRWTDKDGKVHYGDRPAGDAVKAERKKFAAQGAADEEDLPYATRKAKQDFPVTLFVSANCGELCSQARAMLDKRGIPYSEKALKTQEDIDAYKSKYGGKSVPALQVGRQMLNGFSAESWNGELDLAGYPKSATIRRAKPPAKPKAENAEETTEAPATSQ